MAPKFLGKIDEHLNHSMASTVDNFDSGLVTGIIYIFLFCFGQFSYGKNVYEVLGWTKITSNPSSAKGL